jgi:hypothetical protein
MVRREHSIAFVLTGGVLLAAAPTGAEDYAACAKIENPLAYNACLAKQGPPAHATVGEAIPPDADAPKGAGGWTGPGRAQSSLHFARGRHGRMIVEFTVGGAPAAAVKHKTTP